MNSKVLQIFFSILYCYIGIILCFIPLGLYFALKTPSAAGINADFLLQSMSDLLNEGDLIYINLIVAVLGAGLNMMNIVPDFLYRMNTLSDWSALTIILCIMGILIMICTTKLKLAAFSFLIYNGERRDERINIVDTTITFTCFLLCNILAGMIQKTENAMFFAILVCGVCLFFIFVQYRAAKYTYAGKDGYFGSLSRIFVEFIGEFQKAVSLTLMIFFLYYMGNIDSYRLSAETILFVAISCGCGLYFSMSAASSDENTVRRIRSFIFSLILFFAIFYIT